jgi:shikimate dehydrogenase
MKKIFGILSHPVSHSLSPLMHNAAFEHLGINAEFKFFDISSENLDDFFENQVSKRKIEGLAVSIPHKEQVEKYLNYVSPEAQKIGAINTIYWQDDRLCGTNTDYIGFQKAFEYPFESALILGAGGAARACCYALRDKKCYIWARKFDQAQKLADEFGLMVVNDIYEADAELIVNTTPLGMHPKEGVSVVDENYWQTKHIAYDLVMNPCYTQFIKDAQKFGAKIITGEKMLFYQGVEQFKIWTKKDSPQDVVFKKLAKALSQVE